MVPHSVRFFYQDSRHLTSGQALRKWPYKAVRTIMIDPGRISTRQEFATELSLRKDRAGLTVRDIAAKIGVPASTLRGYFGGSHLPPVKMSDLLPRILAVCGVDDAAEVWGQTANYAMGVECVAGRVSRTRSG